MPDRRASVSEGHGMGTASRVGVDPDPSGLGGAASRMCLEGANSGCRAIRLRTTAMGRLLAFDPEIRASAMLHKAGAGMLRRGFADSLHGRRDQDLHGELWRGEGRRLDAGPNGRILGVDPRVPHLVHFFEVAHVREPDGGRQGFGLAAAGFSEQLVDTLEDVAGLVHHGGAGRSQGDLSRHVNRGVVDNDLVHPRTDLVPLDTHFIFSPVLLESILNHPVARSKGGLRERRAPLAGSDARIATTGAWWPSAGRTCASLRLLHL